MKVKSSPDAARRWIITASIAAAAIAVTAVSYMLLRAKIPGIRFALYLAAALSALIILYMVLWSLDAHTRFSRAAKVVRRFYLICLALGIVAFIALEAAIISGSHTENAPADCVIVLGAGLNGDRPYPILAARLNAAATYLREHEDVPVIVSGGQGPGETITEAEAMCRYLVNRGIDESRIWKEDASTSTHENIAFSIKLMEQMGLDADSVTVVIVTNEFHLFRARYIADKAGLDAVGIAVKTPSVGLRFVYYCREALALANTLVFG